MVTSLNSLLSRIREIKVHSQQNISQANHHLEEKISQIYKKGNEVMTFIDALQSEMTSPAVGVSALKKMQQKNPSGTMSLNNSEKKNNNSKIKNQGMSSEMTTENALKMFYKLLDSGDSPESLTLVPYQKRLQSILKQGLYQDLSGKDN